MSSNFQDTFTKNDSTDSLQYDEIAFYFYSSAILTLTLIPLVINFLKQYRNLNRVNKHKLATCQCYYCKNKIQQLKKGKKKPVSFYIKATLILILFLFLGISLKICMQRKDLKTFDPFEILGVEMNSDDTTIKKAFKKMAREFHPDKNPGDPDAHQKFILINKAYQCLESEESRLNCLESGNPEGAKGSYEVGIAMPTFLLKKENKLVILSLFFIFVLFILPALALYFYTTSDQIDAYGTEKSLVYRVLGFYKNEHVQFKNFLQLISTSKDLTHLLNVKSEQVNALKKLAVPEIVQGLNKNFQPFLKPYVLLNAYMMGQKIDPVLEKDFHLILKQTINILNSLVDLSVEFHTSSRFIKQIIGKEVKFDFVQKVIQFCQLFYQGIVMHDSDFLQLAGVTKHNIELVNKKFKKKTVKQFLHSEEDQEKLFKLLKIEKLVEETKKCMSAFPKWKIECENYVQISDDEKDSVVREGDLFTVKITINRDNKVGYIHTKNFPFLKQEILHLFVFYSATQKLIFHRKIVNVENKIEETFNAFAQDKNTQEFQIYLMSDSYINFDEKIVHMVEILPKENEEEFKVHPDDIEALQKGSLYQNMMKELQMEVDSDNEEEEEEEEEKKENSDEEVEEEEMIKEDKQIEATQEEMTHEDIIKDIKESNQQIKKEKFIQKDLNFEFKKFVMKIKVYCRVKPLTKEEQQKTSKRCVNVLDDQKLSLDIKKSINKSNKENELKNSLCGNLFQFQKVFEDYITQSILFKDTCQELVDKFIEGFNATLMAYGQTNSGKTFTVLGEYIQQQLSNLKGIAPRSIDYLFLQLQNQSSEFLFSISVQFMEIYNEKVIDLLDPKNEVLIREKNKNFITENLTEIFVNSKEEIYKLLKKSEENRTTCHTGMNENSSRSHFIFFITLQRENKNNFQIQKSRMTIVDLAGSEKLKRTNVQGKNKIEAQNINQSLTNLGKVILDLSQQKDQGFINYRDSVLTKVLKNSLGGNSLTSLIVTISQSKKNDSETLQTLRFGDRAQNIKNKPMVLKALNPQQMQQKIQDQKEEIKKLKIKIIQLEDQILDSHSPKIKPIQKQTNGETIKQLIIEMQQEKIMQQNKGQKFQTKSFEIFTQDKEDFDFNSSDHCNQISDYFQMKFQEQVRYQEDLLQNFNQKVQHLHAKLDNIRFISDRLSSLKEKFKLGIKRIKIDAFLSSIKSSNQSVQQDNNFLTPCKKQVKKEFRSVNFNRKNFDTPNQLPTIKEETSNSEIEELLSKTSKEDLSTQKTKENTNSYTNKQNPLQWSNSFSKEFESKILISMKVSDQLKQIHQQMNDMQFQLKDLKGQNFLVDKSEEIMQSIQQQQEDISELLIQNYKAQNTISINRTILKQFKKKEKTPQNFDSQILFLQDQIKVQQKLIQYQEEKISEKSKCCKDKIEMEKNFEQKIQQLQKEHNLKLQNLQKDSVNQTKHQQQIENELKKKIEHLKISNDKLNKKISSQTSMEQLEKMEYKKNLEIIQYKKMIKKYQDFIQTQKNCQEQVYQNVLLKENCIKNYLQNLLTEKQIEEIDQIFDQKKIINRNQQLKNNSFNLDKFVRNNFLEETKNEEDSQLNFETEQKEITTSNIKKYYRTPLQDSLLNTKNQLNLNTIKLNFVLILVKTEIIILQ